MTPFPAVKTSVYSLTHSYDQCLLSFYCKSVARSQLAAENKAELRVREQGEVWLDEQGLWGTWGIPPEAGRKLNGWEASKAWHHADPGLHLRKSRPWKGRKRWGQSQATGVYTAPGRGRQKFGKERQ